MAHRPLVCLDIYYISINVISLDTVDFKECESILRITTLWFSESISPLFETDDVVHNVFLNTQCMRYCGVIHIALYKVFYPFQIETYKTDFLTLTYLFLCI